MANILLKHYRDTQIMIKFERYDNFIFSN